MPPPIHQMRLTGRLGSGADEWSCPQCGRRIALRRPPHPELTVLDPGDEEAVHIGVLEPGDPAADAAAARYGVGPVQHVPRPPARPGESGSDENRPADGGPGDPNAQPDAEDRRWLAEIGIDWDGDAAA
ncbi:hypothetical protein TR51_25030 [Kitasatospora griseola]|uniref:Uncharacterized protein n=1 Tax=Kitasatospora griseola TaxID=2064 RepID=A0A0D0PPF3_KITGR|nr:MULTISPECIES: hypothetical protein [Kitasatospora]KIQ62347.1 hypothetical protein TR51_25030 [Kitasatospora griseola]